MEGKFMKSEIVFNIQNQMKSVLNQGQYLKLTNVLLKTFDEIEVINYSNEFVELDNWKLLEFFLEAKKIEGCSLKTISYYEMIICKLLKVMDKSVENITTNDIREYLIDYRENNSVSKVTVDNVRRVFSSFFSWLEEESYILKNPMKRIHRIKTPKILKDTLSDENIEKLCVNTDNIRDLAILELLISTGMRVGELVTLNINDVNLTERECVVFGKGESERVVYFDARCKVHLEEYLDSRLDNNPALFVSLKKPHKRLGINGVEIRIKKIGENCDIKDLHPHKFRRTLATNAIDKGMPIEQVQKLLGHVQIDTTMKYAMVNQNNVKMSHKKFLC